MSTMAGATICPRYNLPYYQSLKVIQNDVVLREIDQAKMQNQGVIVKHHNYRTNKPLDKIKHKVSLEKSLGFFMREF